MSNIVLIGMPGSGKSTVGVLLAKMLGMNFIDADLLIQQREGMKLYEILAQKGNDYFARVEEEVNASIEAENTVIATGGSVIYGEKAMEHLKSIGKVVYLKVPLRELERRIKNFATRGIQMAPGQTLGDLYAERVPLYEKYADITVTTGAAGLMRNAEKIIASISEYA
jgi:shikimate kinase